MTITGTIYELLTKPNPRVDLTGQRQGSVTLSHDYEMLHESRISEWKDFTFANVQGAYGHLFGLGPVVSQADPDLRGTPTQIEKEGDVDALVLLWTSLVCREPLKVAGTRVQRDLGLVPEDISIKFHGATSKTKDSDAKALEPDWAIFLRDSTRTIVVWGDSKCSSKWKSDQNKITRNLKRNWIWPFRQMLTYCVNNNVRYGFVFTPDEMVLMRVSCDDTQSKGKYWGVEYVSIPWIDERNSAPSHGTLTVNLGLWALVLSSLNEAYRTIPRQQDILPLNLWWEDEGKYQHHLSGHQVSRLPAGAIARRRPTASGYVPPASTGRTQRASRARTK